MTRGSSTLTPEREFSWSHADFSRVQKIIYRRAGIRLHEGKHAMAYSRLARRLRDTGHTRFHTYLDWLEGAGPTHPEWQEFVNALTTNLTAFFRERHHFDTLAALLRQRPSGPWHVWCNAASTGEEAYSIAMTALDILSPSAPFKLTASDIDSSVLAAASSGVYRLDETHKLKGLNQEHMQRFFLRGTGVNAGLACVKPQLRRVIEFLQINLMDIIWPLTTPLDAVFCRNVMIYFDAPTQRNVLERIHRVLKPGAFLFVGHSEHLGDARDLFSLRGKTVYERI